MTTALHINVRSSVCSFRACRWLGKLCILVVMMRLVGSASANDHYCGVYCAYSVLDYHDRKIDFEKLLEPRYVAGVRGSTAEGVRAALEDHHISAKVYSGLGVWDLRLANDPLILHVRGSQAMERYEHWVVYSGERSGKAILFDPSRGEEVMDYTELLSIWDGVAVATAGSRRELFQWRLWGLGGRWFLLASLGLVVYPFARWLEPHVDASDRSRTANLARTTGFVGVLTVLGIGLDCLRPTGVLRNSVARASLQSVHTDVEFPELSLEAAFQWFASRSTGGQAVVFIDARYRDDYDLGHIPGAINLPIDASFALEDELMSRIDKDQAIVVYCQSKYCPYANAVAQRLSGRGFRNLHLLTLGYYAWEKEGYETDKRVVSTDDSETMREEQ